MNRYIIGLSTGERLLTDKAPAFTQGGWFELTALEIFKEQVVSKDVDRDSIVQHFLDGHITDRDMEDCSRWYRINSSQVVYIREAGAGCRHTER